MTFQVTQHGLTYDTLNRLTFKAERRLTSLACFASNAVLDQERGMHLSQATTVNVRFRPEVKLEHNKGGGSKIRINIMAEQLVLHCRFGLVCTT